MSEEIKFEKKKTNGSFKQVVKVFIIAILALLMVGGLSYLIIFYQQNHDESNVFGYYKKQPIKLEQNSLFYRYLVSNSELPDAESSGDWNKLMSIWYSAYRTELVAQAMVDLGEKNGIKLTDNLVSKSIIDNGVYSGEDGSNFDEDLYNSRSEAEKKIIFDLFKKYFSYFVISKDLQTVVIGKNEADFISSIAENTRSFDYFVIDYNAIPDSEALSYDISGMETEKDEEGNEIEPTLSQIKAYIASVDPDFALSYIQINVEDAENLVETNFERASNLYGNEIVSVNNAVNNVGNSPVLFNGLNYTDEKGYLAQVFTEDVARTLYTEESGYVAGPFVTDNNEYVFVKITSTEPDDSWKSFTSSIFSYYSMQNYSTAMYNEIYSNNQLKDNFSEKFMQYYLSSVLSNTGV